MEMIQRNVTLHNRTFPVNLPAACPICHRHSEFKQAVADTIGTAGDFQIVFRCGYQSCRKFFICSFAQSGISGTFIGVAPLKPSVGKFSDAIQALSPVFVSTFAEAAEAGCLGLQQIAGPGYRKAFEFLIKDYAKSLAPDKAGEIETNFSGAVVDNYIADERIQAVAKRSLWLGNDETHYLRKWEEHDVDDLIALIKLTCHWIDIEQLSKAYVKAMPETDIPKQKAKG